MNLFELFVKIGVDDQASGKLGELSGKLGNGLKTAAKIGTAAVGAAAAGITALTTAAVNNYAEYEQLVGGVETLFKNSANKVQEYAANAYKTAGMSANEYMSTVTGFSAALLRSVGGDTEKAAKLADTAITDMSDNANKMGVSLESLQNAYTGFSRGNFTMLDNLALGFSGTKEGMQELLDTAKELSGVEYDIESYADIVEAIHVVQTKMGITGTTAKEAASTIQGSIGMMKSAWTNLVAGLADENADLEALTDNFITSVETAANNILPIVDRVITNLVSVLEEKGPDIVAGGAKLLGKLAAGAIKAIPVIISSIPEIIDAIIDGFKESDLDIIEIGADIVRGIWQGISSLAGWIGRKVAGFFDGLFSGVKEHEQIHSPSKKWAFIGKNDALGIASGWDEAFPDVKKRMMDGLDFNTESIGVSASVTGGANGSGGFSVAPQTFVLQLPNGDALASFLVDILRGEARLA